MGRIRDLLELIEQSAAAAAGDSDQGNVQAWLEAILDYCQEMDAALWEIARESLIQGGCRDAV